MVRRKFTCRARTFGRLDWNRLDKIVLTDDFEELIHYLATSVVIAFGGYSIAQIQSKCCPRVRETQCFATPRNTCTAVYDL